VLRLSRFAGIVNIVTAGRITCTGSGFENTTDPCPMETTNGRHYVKMASVNCAAVGDCQYSGVVSVTSASGAVFLDIAAWN
jgi:hypothetical protein